MLSMSERYLRVYSSYFGKFNNTELLVNPLYVRESSFPFLNFNPNLQKSKFSNELTFYVNAAN